MARPSAINATVLLCAALFAISAVAIVAAELPPLPAFKALPEACGAVTQVKPDDTCQTVADFAGISLAKFKELNPFVLCGELPLLPGAPVCIGDPMAYCNNVYIADASDTCQSIAKEVGDITNIDGKANTDCAALKTMDNVPVCVSATADKCSKSEICGAAISEELQAILASQSDYCDILTECQGTAQITTLDGKPSLKYTLTSKTAAVQSALANSGHPELTTFADTLDAGTAAQLTLTVTPDWYADGAGLAFATVSTGEASVVGKKLRKLLATWVPKTYSQAYVPVRVPYRYY